MKTVYDVLEVNRQAALLDIEHSYRRALNLHHVQTGDRTPTKKDEARLRELREAYLVLSSPSRRQAYDRDLRQAALQRGRRLNLLHTVLAVMSVLIGMLLIGAGSYSNLAREKVEMASAPHAIRLPQLLADAQMAQETHDHEGIVSDIEKH